MYVRRLCVLFVFCVSLSLGVDEHRHGLPQALHSVKIIGFGTQQSIPYWIVQNSWGEAWGDKGFFKVGCVLEVL